LSTNSIQYIEGGKDLLGCVQPLWEKTRDYHRDISVHFASKFASQTFGKRKADLLKKSRQDKIHVSLAKDNDVLIGYCVSTIDDDMGEIDSVYVEPSYRGQGIARHMVRAAVGWMNDNGVRSKTLRVAVGNEGVIDFYRSFEPYQIILEEKAQ